MYKDDVYICIKMTLVDNDGMAKFNEEVKNDKVVRLLPDKDSVDGHPSLPVLYKPMRPGDIFFDRRMGKVYIGVVRKIIRK